MIDMRAFAYLLAAGALCCGMPSAYAAPLATAAVKNAGFDNLYIAEGTVEAVRSSVIAPQVAGMITSLPVKAGDHVHAGQTLATIDARAAQQDVAAGAAQAQAAEREYERQQQLFEKHYISQAALDRAEAQWKTARAQAGVANTQSDLHTLTAPYAGIIADVPAQVGDMALPGRALMMLYDPVALRVTAQVPQSSAAALQTRAPVKLEFPGLPTLTATQMTILPIADPTTHTVEVRLALPAGVLNLTPGMFARAWLPLNRANAGSDDSAHLYVPARAVFRRAELDLLYVVDAQDKPALRQVRLGRRVGDDIEILAGVAADERVALDPVAAAAAATTP